MKYLGVVLAFPVVTQARGSAPDTSAKVTFGGFVDGYYAWDFGRPPSFDRSFAGGTVFTTQPPWHNEFNVNLVFVEARLDAPRVRGRLALQAGTSVQSNYSGEPTNGSVSGSSLARNLQEAYAGVKLGSTVWVDAGIFYSHVGMEGWVSRDNPTYTRSLVADYSPYYQSGVKATSGSTSFHRLACCGGPSSAASRIPRRSSRMGRLALHRRATHSSCRRSP